MKRTHLVDSYEYEEYALELRAAPEVWAYVPPSDRRVIQQSLWNIADLMNQATEDYKAKEAKEDGKGEQETSEAKAKTQEEPKKKGGTSQGKK